MRLLKVMLNLKHLCKYTVVGFAQLPIKAYAYILLLQNKPKTLYTLLKNSFNFSCSIGSRDIAFCQLTKTNPVTATQKKEKIPGVTQQKS